ncbi:hypothetical protein GOB57_09115 [Sinorhizobium meliloti]|nr:hypothetical protein [Sinorhizobium meliloti]
MSIVHSLPRIPAHPDDIAVWPDGTWATLGEIKRGEFAWMSDDYEIVAQESDDRLRELGIAWELG